MPIQIDLRRERGMPTVVIRGSVGFYDESDLRRLGAVYRSKNNKRDMPDYWSKEWRSRSGYDIPAPLLKRLYEGNGEMPRPAFMNELQQGWRFPLNSQRVDISTEAESFYQDWRAFGRHLKLIKEGDEDTIDAILANNNIKDEFFSRSPYPHQRAGLAFFFEMLRLGCGHICLFDEMRTGKTFQAIHIAKFLLEKRLVSGVLIIVPNTIKRVWMEELRLDVPLKALFSCMIDGTKAQKKKLWDSGNLFYIVNYESARADEATMRRWEQRKNANGGYLLICDEAHKIKNPDALQTKAITRLQPKYSIFMTGTPVANRPEDAFTMTDFVCPGILGKNIWEFREEFAEKGGYKGKVITGYQNLDEVKYRMARISMRRRRADIMFDKTLYQTRTGQLSGKQKKAYEDMRKLLFAEVINDKGDWTSAKANTGLSKAIRLYQISDGYLSPEPETNVWFDENWKARELDAFIEDYLDDIGKLVIWSRFVPPIDMLTARYRKYGAVKIKGSMKKGAAVDNMYRFQGDPECRIMVANILSAEGKGFQPATFAVMYDKWLSPHMNKQARDRIVGIKNPVPVTIISLVTEKAIDERIEVLLERKRGFSDAVLGDSDVDIKLPVLDKDTLLYLLAKPEEAEKYAKNG